MSITLHLPKQPLLKPKITVFGIGGAGGNAVNNMIQCSLNGVKFVVANTDAQALEYSLAENQIQLGTNLTQGLGAGSLPEIGRGAAEESINEIIEHIGDSNMLFIAAGMGGGTGTGAAPVIARAARENKILTVGVVTKPFHFEGAHRMKVAELGLEELQKYVDTLIIIPNQNLFRIANEKTTFADAFKLADNVLHTGVQGITDLMVMPGLINLDFSDIRTVMTEMGKAMMGTGEAEGDNRAILAAEAAISNPLLDNISMKGARGILINITGGLDMTLFEVDAAANRIREEVDSNANIIFGSTFNDKAAGKIRVSVLATGIGGDDVINSPYKEKYIPVSEIKKNVEEETQDDEGNNSSDEGLSIASYIPDDPEEEEEHYEANFGNSYTASDEYKDLNKRPITTQKTNMNLFNRVSEVIRSQKQQPKKNDSSKDLEWAEHSLDIPAFLRKKQ